MNLWLRGEWGGLGVCVSSVWVGEEGSKDGVVWRGRRRDRKVVVVSVEMKRNSILSLTLPLNRNPPKRQKI